MLVSLHSSAAVLLLWLGFPRTDSFAVLPSGIAKKPTTGVFGVPVREDTTSGTSLRMVASISSNSTDILSSSLLAHQPLNEVVRSVNYFVSRECNYACKFCFHTQKNSEVLPLSEAIRGLQLLRKAGTEKINFAGGEPFLNPLLLGTLCKTAHELGMAVSIISNGSLITKEWLQDFGYYVDVLGVSIDSFSTETNTRIGRSQVGHDHLHVSRILQVREWCEEYHIQFKANTVVCKLNWEEDMTTNMKLLDPVRWKVFQVLILEGENAGNGDLRDARNLIVSKDQYDSFVQRHLPQFSTVLVPESNDVMQNSYLLLDEKLRFLDCSDGGKIPSESILKVGVEKALSQAGFDYEMFHHRGGIFEWERDRTK